MTEMDKSTANIIGIAFLVGMVIMVILAVATFEGTPTIILLISASIFLLVGVFFLGGGTEGGIASGSGSSGSSQQQSVVLDNGRVVTQGGSSGQSSSGPGGVQVVCGGCNARNPDSARFCSSCGASL